MLTPLYVLTMLESFNGILSFALAATKLVLEAGAYLRYESRILVFAGFKKEEKATVESESGLFLTLRLGTSGALNENPRPLFNKKIPTINVKLLLTLGKLFSNEEK